MTCSLAGEASSWTSSFDAVPLSAAAGLLSSAAAFCDFKSSLTACGQIWLSNQTICNINELILKFIQRDQFRGMSGEIMKQCCTDFIRNCSLGNVEVTAQCLGKSLTCHYQVIIDNVKEFL